MQPFQQPLGRLDGGGLAWAVALAFDAGVAVIGGIGVDALDRDGPWLPTCRVNASFNR